MRSNVRKLAIGLIALSLIQYFCLSLFDYYITISVLPLKILNFRFYEVNILAMWLYKHYGCYSLLALKLGAFMLLVTTSCFLFRVRQYGLLLGLLAFVNGLVTAVLAHLIILILDALRFAIALL